MRIPQATYRLQFTPDFGFRQATDIVAYLADLGISDLYASPIFRARQGSMHGYDMIDPSSLNPELGTPRQFARLTGTVKKYGMGWLQDIVPNHMTFDAQNPYLADILENGPGSAYYRYFDIDWEHYYEAIHGKVLAPFLGSYYGQSLENGELRLGYRADGFAVSYHTLRFPLKIESYLSILADSVAAVRQELGEEHPDYIQLLGILYVLKTLRSDAGNDERRAQVKFIKQILQALHRNNPTIRKAVAAAVKSFNGRRGEPQSFNRLEGLLAEQWFRLAFWKVACEEINYRRFFSINDLISLRIERAEVFNHTHALLLRLFREGHFTGFRIDHIDGLYDPAAYLERLRAQVPDAYLVVEKILAAEEPLPAWPIEGTTGYDFMNALTGVFCETASAKVFSDQYQRFTGQRQSCAELLYASKKRIIERSLLGDVNNLAHRLKKIASRHRYGSDITMDSLKRALIEVLAEFPVYRSYLDSADIRSIDRRFIETALERARARNPSYLNELDYIGKVLLGQIEQFLPNEERAHWLHFAMRFQQLSGPLMAKGLEDTLLYVYNRLLSLNDVGGEPARFGLPLTAFHTFNRQRRERWPQTLNATSTHDTKRGEDVRARLNVLSELPREWAQQIRGWSRLNRSQKRTLKRSRVPDKNDEYFLYQTLLGAWPFAEEDVPEFISRLKDYLVKAVREAKVHTTWLKPDTDYEDAFLAFVDRILAARQNSAFLREFLPFQRRVAYFGMLNGLAQTLVKITAPGIPDFYQGSELWDLNLVDPDNRRPVDYAGRIEALQGIMGREASDLEGLIAELLADMTDGRIKLFLIHRALAMRNRHARLFREGDYHPLQVSGPHAGQVIAYARRLGDEIAVTVVPRLLAGWIEDGTLPLGREVWKETVLEWPEDLPAAWRDAFTGAEVSATDAREIGAVLQRFPAALLLGRRT